ncbi:Transcriptional regulator, MerR family [Frankia sp. AiPs1]|uniref:MerR family transcriptional regulator n=1 Tax=Frankia sp. AiPa1 TaxID=573492 RepID=UPI00202ADBF7|nr:MerR family transcriptional regulator [Frankia sp. AiPa1]MCL9759342.1 MerR family transcriptional regulator [Frankia sp. AiPa1]
MAHSADDPLVPIDEVARRVGLRASAIRYYEQRGLIDPAVQSAGRRWYRPAEIRRLAVIRYWQRAALISLDDIADLLTDRPPPMWKQTIEAQIQRLQVKADRLLAARELLEHILDHHGDASPDGCPHYEALIWSDEGPPATTPAARSWLP